MNQLSILKLSFSLVATRRYVNKGYIGNRLRGALGRALASLYCDPHAADVSSDFDGCRCIPPCVYGAVFKPTCTHPEFTTVPSPFAIGASDMDFSEIEAGSRRTFQIKLYGQATSYWKHMVDAVQAVFSREEGIFYKDEERLNRSFRLERVTSELDGTPVYENGCYVGEPMAALWRDDVMQMPVQSHVGNGAEHSVLKPGQSRKEDGKERVTDYHAEKSAENAAKNAARKVVADEEIEVLVKFRSHLIMKEPEAPKKLDFSTFMDAVMLRIASIADIYGEQAFVVPYGLLFRKPKVEAIPVKGRHLSVVFRGPIQKYLPYIELGSQLHIGKKSTYGFGEYEYRVMETTDQ